MDQLNDYCAIVRAIMDEYADYLPATDGVELEKVYDESHGHYELLLVGWEGHHRTHGIVLHMDIRDGKIWIQHDGTAEGVAHDLERAGIPKDRIVLAFHPPYKRPLTGYAVA